MEYFGQLEPTTAQETRSTAVKYKYIAVSPEMKVAFNGAGAIHSVFYGFRK